MSTWYYYDNDGHKQGPVTGGQLKWLAKNGKITPGTMVEPEEGKAAPARKVKGLTFVEASQPRPSPPPVAPNPFTATPPASANPFTAAPPTTVNPFVAAPPVAYTSEHSEPVTDGSKKLLWRTIGTVGIVIVIVIQLFIFGKETLINKTKENKATSSTTAQTQKFTAAEQAEIDRFFARYGRDIKRMDEDGETLLHIAVVGGWDVAVTQALITAGANVNAKNMAGSTPLHDAPFAKSIAVVQFLVARGAHVNAKNSNGLTPLHNAALAENVEVAQFLISKKADVNAKDNVGGTPLHAAADQGNVEIAKLLVANKASINAKSPHIGTPLDAAKRKRHMAMISYLAGIGGR